MNSANADADPADGRDWPESVEEVLDGDLAVIMADVTAAKGVVLTPLTNFGLQNRADGEITLLSSLGAWRKLARIRKNPRVALAFHTRRHGYAEGNEHYVLVQGEASFSTTPDRAWLESIEPNWVRFMGPRDTGLWERWTRIYQWERIGVRIKVERVISWPDLQCTTTPQVHGRPLPDSAPPSQSPPKNGIAPRVDVSRVARHISALPDSLLGWVGQDGFPVVVPVTAAEVTERGLALSVPKGMVPPGGRRAGLTSHWFTAGVLGQEQRLQTGWIEAGEDASKVFYSPHTTAGYHMPPSKTLYRLAVGAMTRSGMRKARRAGFLDERAQSNGTPPPSSSR